MPSKNETRSELEKYFIAGWGSRTPISHDNVPFDDDDVDEYVSIRFTLYPSTNVNVGSQKCKHIRHSGLFAIVIYTRIGISAVSAYEHVDFISDLMDNKGIVTNLYTEASTARRNGEQTDGWYSVIVRVPFVSDEF